MSKITNDGLTHSDTRCFVAVPIWQQWAGQRVGMLSLSEFCTCVSSSSCLTSSSRAFSSRRSILTSFSSSDRRCLHWSAEHSTDDLPAQTEHNESNQHHTAKLLQRTQAVDSDDTGHITSQQYHMYCD